MKRPAVLIVGAVAGALVVAAVGASAHTGLFISKSAGVQSAVSGDEASNARVEPTDTPEPTEAPEAPPTAEPTETPEPADNDTETNDDQHTGTQTGDHESGNHETGGGGHDD